MTSLCSGGRTERQGTPPKQHRGRRVAAGSAHLPIAAEAGFVEVLALTATVGPAAPRPPVGRAPTAGAPRRDTATERPRHASPTATHEDHRHGPEKEVGDASG